MGLSRAHQRAGVHPYGRAGALRRRLLLNRDSNVFPGILGRTCDRPCEPACRRVRVEEKPVAICRIKRVAADLKGDISARLPKAPATKNGKRVACIGAGPASLTVANDLMPLGYEVVVFEKNTRPGGLMRTNVPSFRLPAAVLDEEIAMIVDMGVEVRYGTPVQSLKALLGPGLRRGLRRLGRAAGQGSRSAGAQGSGRAHPHRHRLAGERRLRSHRHDRRARPHHRRRQHRDGLLPHGATPGRQGRQGDGPPRPRSTSRPRPGSWRTPKRSRSTSWSTTSPRASCSRTASWSAWSSSARPPAGPERRRSFFPPTTSSSRSARRTPSPTSSATSGSSSASGTCPRSTRRPCRRRGRGSSSAATRPGARRTSSGPSRTGTRRRSRSTTTARGSRSTERPAAHMSLVTQKMGLTEWSYSNDYNTAHRAKMKHVDLKERFKQLSIEVEMGFDHEQTVREVERCLNCDVQTAFTDKRCIECDACVDVCPTSCLTITANGEEPELRQRLTVPATNTDPGDLRVGRAAADRPGDGQGRGRLRPLRPVRRALPDGGLGHGAGRAHSSQGRAKYERNRGHPGCVSRQGGRTPASRPRLGTIGTKTCISGR